MALEAAKARVNPAPHVIRAKCLDMFKEADLGFDLIRFLYQFSHYL